MAAGWGSREAWVRCRAAAGAECSVAGEVPLLTSCEGRDLCQGESGSGALLGVPWRYCLTGWSLGIVLPPWRCVQRRVLCAERA
jgi:hypothetical protein